MIEPSNIGRATSADASKSARMKNLAKLNGAYVVVTGGGDRTRGIINYCTVAASGRLFVNVTTHLGSFTFPQEAVELEVRK